MDNPGEIMTIFALLCTKHLPSDIISPKELIP
jgi:hypothetical protein